MNREKIALLASLLLCAATPVTGGEFPEIQRGMCGPAKAVHNYLDEAGFFEEVSLAVLRPDGVHLTYLPTPERVKSLKSENGQYFLGLEKIHVVHSDWTREHPENWRCITDVTLIGNPGRKALTKYLNEIESIIP